MASVVVVATVMSLAHAYVLFRNTQEVKDTLKNKSLMKLMILVSIFGIGSVVFAALALNDALASYVLSIRRLDVLITVIIGWKFMGESNFKRRITGALIMLAGVILISFN